MKKLKLRWNDLCNIILPIMTEARFRPRSINSLNNWNSTQFILTSLNWFCSLKADWWLIHPLSYFTETVLHTCHLCPPAAPWTKVSPSLTAPHRTKGSGHNGNFTTGCFWEHRVSCAGRSGAEASYHKGSISKTLQSSSPHQCFWIHVPCNSLKPSDYKPRSLRFFFNMYMCTFVLFGILLLPAASKSGYFPQDFPWATCASLL